MAIQNTGHGRGKDVDQDADRKRHHGGAGAAAGQDEAELEGRRGAEERDHESHESTVEVLKSQKTPAGTLQWQMRECGHKDRCNKCKSGERHGPYLYRFYYRDGKRHSEYISLTKARSLGLERPSVPR